MYEAEYGTDWERLTTEAAIERAYALGVAEMLGEVHEAEFERLIDEAETPGDRALVRLAYDKGRSRGRTARQETANVDDAWGAVVNEEEQSPVVIEERRDLPRALRRLPLLEKPSEGQGLLQLPKFLLR